MGAKSNDPLRQDVLRGIRWGMIMLISILMGIAGYRMFGTSPVTAAPKVVAPTAPAAESDSVNPPATIEAGEGAPSQANPAIKGPDVPVAPPPRRRAAPPPQPENRSKAFIPPSVTNSHAAMDQNLVENLPEVQTIEVHPEPVASPKAVVNVKPEDKGSRAGKLARSVGRVFGFGRKDPPVPAK
jgi:hypothetical protein